MFGITSGELVVLLIIALVVIGPERLPRHAEQLGRLVRSLRSMATDARTRVTEELGPEAAEFDWDALDLRRYDPRRIVREALAEPRAPHARPGGPATPDYSGPAPYDTEAT